MRSKVKEMSRLRCVEVWEVGRESRREERAERGVQEKGGSAKYEVDAHDIVCWCSEQKSLVDLLSSKNTVRPKIVGRGT